MDDVERDVSEILLEIRAVTLNPERPYRFVSGILSPVYCDNRLILSYPDKRKAVTNHFIEKIKETCSNFDVIAGVATSGIPHAAWIADRLGKPMIYVRSSKKEHGKGNLVEGKLEKGQDVIVIEDLISTGGSSVSAVNAVKEAGGKVIKCIAIFTYGMEKAKKMFEEAKCDLVPLSNFDTLIEVASDRNYIRAEDKERILEWRKDPENWGRRMGFE